MFNREKIQEENYKHLTDDIAAILKGLPEKPKNRNFLDIGCGKGEKTLKWAKEANIIRENVFGLDVTDKYLKKAKNRFKAYEVDFETQLFPFANPTFDLILCSQVFEHIKNIHILMSEIYRVLKIGGYLILSTPNLASLHNRILLLLAKQPTSIKIFSEHIRGFTGGELESFVSINPDLKIIKTHGSGFYPFMPAVGEKAARILPSFAVYKILVIQKIGDGFKNVWFDKFGKFVGQTDYYLPDPGKQ